MAKGMFVDTSICTGCKACQVACKEWNGLEPEPEPFQKRSGDTLAGDSILPATLTTTRAKLSATDWRHVRFIEQFNDKPHRIALAVYERFVQTLHRCRLPERLPGERHRPHRPGQCVRAAGQVHRYKALQHRLPLRRDQVQRENAIRLTSARCATTGSITAWARHAPRPAPPARSASAKSRNSKPRRMRGWRSSGRWVKAKANIYGYNEAEGLNVFYLLMDKPAGIRTAGESRWCRNVRSRSRRSPPNSMHWLRV